MTDAMPRSPSSTSRTSNCSRVRPRSPPAATPRRRLRRAHGHDRRRASARKLLGYNITAVPPGKRAFPLHNHVVNEEMFFVLEGSGELRVGDATHPVRAGDIIACPPGGPETAHQLVNTGDAELKYLAVSTTLSPEVCDYPDSGKFGVSVYGDERTPGRLALPPHRPRRRRARLLGRRIAMFSQDPDRQPRRDRLPRHPHRAPARHPHRRRVFRSRRRRAARAPGRRGLADRRTAAAGFLPARRCDHRSRHAIRRAGDPSRLRLPQRERRLRRRGGSGRPGLHRPERRVDAQDGQQGRRQGTDAGRGRAGRAGLHRRGPVAATCLQREADRIGFPLMIKAAHGGGGKGMRIVRAPDEFLPNLESCQREAASAFGRDRVLLERYIEQPRHIEIQVFGDAHGNVIHLNERECSAQRRYQKVLEESPSPFLTPELRAAMGAAAVQAARAIDYANAGTVEFIVGAGRRVLFHGDQHAAAGRASGDRTGDRAGPGRMAAARRRRRSRCRCAQDDSRASDGHAIEVRLYAEDPEAGFLPGSGKLEAPAPAGADRARAHRFAAWSKATPSRSSTTR